MILPSLKGTHLDALMEISNIGVGHAATAFSQLLGTRVDIKVPSLSVTELKDAPEKLGGADTPVVMMFLRMLGDAKGDIAVIFPKDSADRMVAMLLRQEVDTVDIFGDMGQSALKEVGNILASAYLSAMGSLLNLNLIPSTPSVAYDMLGSLIDSALADAARNEESVILVETRFSIKDVNLSGSFSLIPEPESLETLLSLLKDRKEA